MQRKKKRPAHPGQGAQAKNQQRVFTLPCFHKNVKRGREHYRRRGVR